MRSITSIFLCLCLMLEISCKSHLKKDAPINATWHKLSLPNGWTVYAPLNFTCFIGQGVDSEPGHIISRKDSIILSFDSGSHERDNSSCDFQDQYQKAKRFINSGVYQTYYNVPFKSIIDTIENRIAVITTPAVIGTGAIHVAILGCKNEPWLGITSENLPARKQELVLAIYRSIRQTKSD